MPFLANRGEGWVEQNEPIPGTVLISITEPGRQARIPKGYADILRLEFQDYDTMFRPVDPETGMYTSVPPTPRKIPEGAVLMTPTHAARLSRFARKHRGENIIVHCAAGISRSGGVVEALLEAFPEYEDLGWPRHPNGHVKSLVKRAMGLVPLGWEEPGQEGEL